MMPLSLRQTTDDDRRLGGDFIFWDSFGDREIPNFPEGPYCAVKIVHVGEKTFSHDFHTKSAHF